MNIFPCNKISESVFFFKKEINDRGIIIDFSKNFIRFGIEQRRDKTKSQEPKHWFTIDLSTAKSIGNDILNIPIFPNYVQCDWKDFFRDFVVEMESDDGIFATSPFANNAREKLKKSHIYNLIVAKGKYDDYIREDHKHLDVYEYNRIVSEYVDLLMWPKLPSILPPNKVGEGFLFENPEYELQRIVEGKIATHKMEEGLPELDTNITKKIQNYFLLKNSTISAYSNKYSQNSYMVFIALMALCSTVTIVTCIYGWSNINFFIRITLLVTISIVGILTLICFNKNAIKLKNYNLVFPRIFIALLISYSLISLSGDFVFSLFEIAPCSLSIFVVASCFLIVTVLWYDSVSHSPYYKIRSEWKELRRVSIKKKYNGRYFEKTCNFKIIPILSFSIFLSLVIGIIIQLTTYQSLLKTGNTLHTVTFSSEFKKIEHHITVTQLLIDNLEAYKRELITLPTQALDSMNICENREVQINTIKQQFNKCHKNRIIADLLTSVTKYRPKTEQRLINSIDSLLLLLHSHVYQHQNFVDKYSDTDSLLNLCYDKKYRDNCKSDIPIYNQFLKEKVSQDNVISIPIPCLDSNHLFPKLLVFHAFLAVLIAFVIQIVFTGKSITEPL